MASTNHQKRPLGDRSLTPIKLVPPLKEKQPPDPNMNNPRLSLNRSCIYERQLPGDAYITAHVERLQHGYYSNSTVSDEDSNHVDFLAIGFTFHSPNTLSHRFKSAKIRVSIRGPREISSSSHHPYGHPPGNPRFLMHAPHLLYGTVSPETMEWTFSLAGSLGISEMPVSASVIPSGSVNNRYRRYEMMRIQGSARTLKSDQGRSFDVEAGEIVWSLEENDLQRSGLPREFTFVMLIHKPAADSRLSLSIDIDPVIAAKIGNYPSPMLKLPAFQPLPRRGGIDFRREIGQRFEPLDPGRGYNFAAMASMFDEYIAMPGRKFSRQIQIPPESPLPESHFQPSYPGQYGSLNPYQQQLQIQNMALANNGLNLQNNLLQTTLQSLWKGGQPQDEDQEQEQEQQQPTIPATMPQSDQNPVMVNLHVHIDSATASQFANLQLRSPLQTRIPGLRRSRAREFSSGTSTETTRDALIPENANLRYERPLEERRGEDEMKKNLPRQDSVPEPVGTLKDDQQAGGDRPANVNGNLNGNDNSNGNIRFDYARARRGVMNMANSPLSTSLLAILSERGGN